MSATIIYKIKKDETAHQAFLIGNAWRGAMAIWMCLEEKYLPMYRPEHIKTTRWYTPNMSDEDIVHHLHYRPSRMQPGVPNVDRDDLWNLESNPDISPVDRICLMTTFDRTLVRKEYLPTVIFAFEHFDGDTSLKSQAEALKKLLDDEDCIAVGWNQNSISDSLWDISTDENGNETFYRINPEDDIFFVFEDENSRPLLGCETKN